jgi:hypothetical protein
MLTASVASPTGYTCRWCVHACACVLVHARACVGVLPSRGRAHERWCVGVRVSVSVRWCLCVCVSADVRGRLCKTSGCIPGCSGAQREYACASPSGNGPARSLGGSIAFLLHRSCTLRPTVQASTRCRCVCQSTGSVPRAACVCSMEYVERGLARKCACAGLCVCRCVHVRVRVCLCGYICVV